MPATVRWYRRIVWTRRVSSPPSTNAAKASESGSGPSLPSGPAGLRGFRRVLDVDPPTLREVDEHPRPTELEHEVLAPAPDPVQDTAGELGGARGHGLQRGERQQVRRAERRAPEGVGQPLGERLEIGELGHGVTRSRPPRDG